MRAATTSVRRSPRRRFADSSSPAAIQAEQHASAVALLRNGHRDGMTMSNTTRARRGTSPMVVPVPSSSTKKTSRRCRLTFRITFDALSGRAGRILGAGSLTGRIILRSRRSLP